MTTAAERVQKTLRQVQHAINYHANPELYEALDEIIRLREQLDAVRKLCDKREKAGAVHVLIAAVRAAIGDAGHQ